MQNNYMPEGEYILNEANARYCRDEKMLLRARSEKRILEANVVLCDKWMNLTVNLGNGIIGIIPKDQAVYQPDGTPVKDIAILTRVGKPVCFHVCDVVLENGRKTAYLSRASAQKECYTNYLSTLNCGDIIPCKITHTEQFGAFADVGCGLIALLPVDCISVSRINHPNERFSVGMSVKCAVRSIDKSNKRIFITTKELFGTWEENCSFFASGQTVRGVIRSVEPYGVFIELAPNLAGLAEYSDDVTVGTSAAVYIKSINPEKMKIKLVIVSCGKDVCQPSTPKYFIPDTVKHIRKWRYSPENSCKCIETVF